MTKVKDKTKAPLKSTDLPTEDLASNGVQEKTEDMSKDTKTKEKMEEKKTETSVEASTGVSKTKTSAKTDKQTDNRLPRRKNFRKNTRRTSRKPRVKSEFDQKIIGIRRVTRVVSGGRRFSFSIGVVIGNRKGKVGVGLGKATDTALAIDKAVRDAKKNMIEIKLDENKSIPHEIKAKYNASIVEIRPAPGRGIVVGSSVRDVVELAGIKDVSAKLLSRSKNKINNARVAIKALSELKV